MLLDHGASSYRESQIVFVFVFSIVSIMYSLPFVFVGLGNFVTISFFPFNFFSSFNIEWYFFSCGQMVA